MLAPLFVTAADVKTAFDTAVAIQEINLTVAANMGPALTKNAARLGLDLTVYTSLTNKDPVHAALAGQSFTTAAQVKTAFDAAVAAEAAIEAAP